MADKGNRLKEEATCPTCGKRIALPGGGGSITSYLFQPFYCSCQRMTSRLSDPTYQPPPRLPDKLEKDSSVEFCPDCGLQKTTASPGGSMTGFLFQATRCKCLPKDQILDPEMANRFWKLKQTDAGKTFGSAPVQSPTNEKISYTRIDALKDAVIGGAYCIIKSIGSGGMGEVYLAKHLTLGKTCALKLIPPDQVTDIIWQRFQNEARTIASLDHINLVKVTDLGIHQGCLPYYAMEYVDGQTMADMLKNTGPLPLPMVLDIFMQICDGVDYAHRKGVVHRDLKPGNIMLGKSQGGKFSVKILDFGLVKIVQKDRHQQSLTKIGEVFGTPFYMSPEQCMSGKIDNRSDIYSLGCTMFESLTGRPPFMAASPMDTIICHMTADPPTLDSIVGPNVFPESLEVVLAKLLRKNPVERYQTLLELRGDLEKVSRGEVVEPYYVSRSKPAPTIPPAKETSREIPGPQAGQPSSLAGRHSKIMAMIAVTSTISIATLTGVVMRNQPVRPTALSKLEAANAVSQQQDTHPAPAQVAPASARETRPFSTIIEDNGHKWRIFNFPEDITIGCTKTPAGQSLEAKGKLRYNAEDHIFFTPFPSALKYPSYLKRFRAGDIYEILPENPGNLSAHDYGGSEACLQATSCIPGVQALNLNGCEDLTNKSLSSIEKFPSLTDLYLMDKVIDAATLSQLSTLKQLRLLNLEGYEDVTPILAKLQQSTKMKKLILQHSRIPLDAISCPASLPNLEQLEFDQIIPSTPDSSTRAINLLSKNANLERLMIGKLPIGDDTIVALKGLKALKALAFDPDLSSLTVETRRKLFKELPNVMLEDLMRRELKNR